MRRLCVAAMAMALTAIPALAADPKGDWMVEDKTAVVRIAACGSALCGAIAWTKEPGVDENNPDPAKRTRPIVGLQILLGMKPSGQDRWEGEIYNPQNGKTYNAKLTSKSAQVLRVEGCLIGGFLCGGEDWTRVNNPAAAPKAPEKARP